jgi:hypothetical protein
MRGHCSARRAIDWSRSGEKLRCCRESGGGFVEARAVRCTDDRDVLGEIAKRVVMCSL